MKIIAGILKNRSLFAPKGETTRPTSSRLRESLFNICQHEIEGATFLDLFAGSGAMGFEALSRGAVAATFVDNDRNAIQSIRRNSENLDVKATSRIISGDVMQVLERMIRQEEGFDIIYADPPYEHKYSNLILKAIDTSTLLKNEGTFFLEEGGKARLDFESLQNLKLISKRSCGQSTLYELKMGLCDR